MSDREKILENAFGSVQAFVDSGEKFCRRQGMYGNVLEDMISEYCTAGLDAAGRADIDKTPMEVKAFIVRRAKGAVVDYGRDKIYQKRTSKKTKTVSIDASIGEDDYTMHDTLDSKVATPLDNVASHEEKELLYSIINSLATSQRELIYAIIDGQTMVEIAEKRGVSKQAISKAYGEAINTLRRAVA